MNCLVKKIGEDNVLSSESFVKNNIVQPVIFPKLLSAIVCFDRIDVKSIEGLRNLVRIQDDLGA